jgi:hypothetical protein
MRSVQDTCVKIMDQFHYIVKILFSKIISFLGIFKYKYVHAYFVFSHLSTYLPVCTLKFLNKIKFHWARILKDSIITYLGPHRHNLGTLGNFFCFAGGKRGQQNLRKFHKCKSCQTNYKACIH